MSIEKALADLTVALNENTAALKAAAGGGKSASTSSGSTGGTASTSTKSTKETKPSLERGQVNAALTEVKEKKGAPAAKAIIKEVGGVERMADIPEDKFAAVYDAAKKAVAEEEEDGGI